MSGIYLQTLSEILSNNQNLITVISGLLSAISAVLLAVLYLRQNQIQSEQTGIMENQQRLMEAEHQPHVELDEIRYFPSGPHWGSKLIFSLSNTGKGTATDLTITQVPELLGESQEIVLESSTYQISRNPPAESVSDGGEDQIFSEGDYLRGGETKVDFFGPAWINFSFHNTDTTARMGPREMTFSIANQISEDELELPTDRTWMMYTVSLPDGQKYMTPAQLDSDLLPEGVDIDVEETEVPKLTEETDKRIQDFAEDVLDFDRIRIKFTLSYQDLQGENYEDEIVDFVLPLRHDVSEEILYKAAMKYEEYTKVADEELDFRIANTVKRSKDSSSE